MLFMVIKIDQVAALRDKSWFIISDNCNKGKHLRIGQKPIAMVPYG